MENIHITEKEMVDYKSGENSATLNMAIAFEMPYIVEKNVTNANKTEQTLMVAELLSKYNGEETMYFLQTLVNGFEIINNSILGVSLLTIAKTAQNHEAEAYLSQMGAREQGTAEEALKVINVFNDEEKVGSDDMLNFIVNESKRLIK